MKRKENNSQKTQISPFLFIAGDFRKEWRELLISSCAASSPPLLCFALNISKQGFRDHFFLSRLPSSLSLSPVSLLFLSLFSAAVLNGLTEGCPDRWQYDRLGRGKLPGVHDG